MEEFILCNNYSWFPQGAPNKYWSLTSFRENKEGYIFGVVGEPWDQTIKKNASNFTSR